MKAYDEFKQQFEQEIGIEGVVTHLCNLLRFGFEKSKG